MILDRHDEIAAEQVRYWQSEGWTPAEMIRAVSGRDEPDASLDDAHHTIAAWSMYLLNPPC